MADLIGGHDAAWWKAQWEALKAELDSVNPRHDAAAARVAELGAALADARAARDAAERKAADLAAALEARTAELVRAVDAKAAELEAAKADHAAKAARAGAVIAAHAETIAGHEGTIAALTAERDAARDLAEKRRLAVVPVVKMVGDLYAALTPLVAPQPE